jgi:dTMP kinase
MKKGYYIMLEGGEGCGKDSHAESLVGYLKSLGCSVVLTREPGGTKKGEQIRTILLDKTRSLTPMQELYLFEEARLSSYKNIVIPGVEKGEVIIKTRGWPSTIAYQGYAGGIDLDQIRKLNNKATFNIMPDLLIIIDVPPEKGLKKELDADRFAQKGLGYHEKVNQGYLSIAKEHPEFSIVIPYQEGEFDAMQEQIRNAVRKNLGI